MIKASLPCVLELPAYQAEEAGMVAACLVGSAPNGQAVI